MTLAFQQSLFDMDGDANGEVDGEDVTVRPLRGSVRRTTLGDGAWLDLRRGWLAGADILFERLRDAVPWRAESRVMYDRTVAVPRLLCFYGEGQALPDAALAEARDVLDVHYRAELGESFATAGLCFYRDGRDSVAWHGDRFGRSRTEDTIIAILSVGAPRGLLLRPRNGGPSQRFEVGNGDLLVMGGSCQRTWDHSVPKTTTPTGPRISVQFRPRGVR